ncbi:hypothetical protein [Streptomyces griseoruber]|uniref:Secreted protein n=1 Tax=Streptomyces griseoruber TaxID=1943 RepID=A0A117R9P1_9ACTN|nr:hypothetical protein [Streptomyces griseoruber]KUN78778.1 hypothetical protein AQJ64_30210 [Streptomyces griseoruber]
MPRGRHRHSPPLHRLLPPSAIAGVSLICAFGPWVLSDPAVLRVVAAVAAATAIVGAAVLRRWDTHAGKQVADLTRARASDEWRFEERVAELETDLDESRELRGKLEKRLRAKRAELAGLRNEHAALLRRYATAETERASALEGRRLLEIENTAEPEPHALPSAHGSEPAEQDTETAVSETPEAAETVESGATADAEPKAPAAFSPEGSQLYARARSALAKLDPDAAPAGAADDSGAQEPVKVPSGKAGGEDSAQEDEAEGQPEAADEHTRAVAPHTADETDAGRATDRTAPEPTRTGTDEATSDEAASDRTAAARAASERAAAEPAASERAAAAAAHSGGVASPAARAEGVASPAPAAGRAASPATADAVGAAPAAVSEAADRAVSEPVPAEAPAVSAALVPRPAAPVVRPSGHFTVPTAVAVVPAAQPVRRPAVQGGFDFFGTKSATPNALESVQNEDLADVVGQEALALHKAEAEAEFKPAGEEARGVGQVIDLTAHDETEVIDLQGLRSAVS